VTARGIRNNNPGNIRKSRTLWQGEAPAQPDPDFVTFVSAAYGIRAIAKILLNYQAAGFNTVRKIVSRWAPPSENDTEAYVADVAHDVGLGPDQLVELHVLARLVAVMKALVRHEEGVQPYPDTEYVAGAELAGVHA